MILYLHKSINGYYDITTKENYCFLGIFFNNGFVERVSNNFPIKTLYKRLAKEYNCKKLVLKF